MKNYNSISLIHSNLNSKVYSAVSIQDKQTYILKYLLKNPVTTERLQS
jgi:hypothetical protein